jgi:hypothetical protein
MGDEVSKRTKTAFEKSVAHGGWPGAFVTGKAGGQQ